MKYIIMCDGKGTRWNNYMDIPKHLVKIDNIPLIQDTINKLYNLKISDIVVTSHDERYNFSNATRYAPLNNIMEIDRFTYELIDDDVVFLYGDTYYNEESIEKIVNTKSNETLYFGDDKSIYAIKVVNGKLFKDCIYNLRSNKDIKGNGWNTYEYLYNKPLNSKEHDINFINIDGCININAKDDLERLVKYGKISK